MNCLAALLLTIAAASEAPAASASPASPPIGWIVGPTTVVLGSEAELWVPGGLAFAGARDSATMLKAMGNTVTGLELGLVSPLAEGDDWVLVFEYHDVGHVPDEEKDRIDPEALLQVLRRQAEEDGRRRREQGLPALSITGWYEPPHYDPQSRHLVWAPQGRSDDGRELVNYNLRLLGREGFMAVSLIDQPGRLATSRLAALTVLQGFSFKAGRTYADYRPGDRVAGQGLIALLTGGLPADAASRLFLAGWIGAIALAAGLALRQAVQRRAARRAAQSRRP